MGINKLATDNKFIGFDGAAVLDDAVVRVTQQGSTVKLTVEWLSMAVGAQMTAADARELAFALHLIAASIELYDTFPPELT